MPRRESVTTRDKREYPLWADIKDLMSAVMAAHWSPSRDQRRDRGWMFRGQASSEWDLLPSLYRPPYNDALLKLRSDYTLSFIDALRPEARAFGLSRMADSQYFAIAQHYGFYTDLLDFSWNVETAAYFATAGGQAGQTGAIFAFSTREYQELRNPFASLGSSSEESDRLLRESGMEPLPDLELVELYNIPRIFPNRKASSFALRPPNSRRSPANV
jgi:hypothetical protein